MSNIILPYRIITFPSMPYCNCLYMVLRRLIKLKTVQPVCDTPDGGEDIRDQNIATHSNLLTFVRRGDLYSW
jgi:hypothetical protein